VGQGTGYSAFAPSPQASGQPASGPAQVGQVYASPLPTAQTMEQESPGGAGVASAFVAPLAGLAAWTLPDPDSQAAERFAPATRLMRTEQRGLWARVADPAGRAAWVDSRLLLPEASAEAVALSQAAARQAAAGLDTLSVTRGAVGAGSGASGTTTPFGLLPGALPDTRVGPGWSGSPVPSPGPAHQAWGRDRSAPRLPGTRVAMWAVRRVVALVIALAAAVAMVVSAFLPWLNLKRPSFTGHPSAMQIPFTFFVDLRSNTGALFNPNLPMSVVIFFVAALALLAAFFGKGLIGRLVVGVLAVLAVLLFASQISRQAVRTVVIDHHSMILGAGATWQKLAGVGPLVLGIAGVVLVLSGILAKGIVRLH